MHGMPMTLKVFLGLAFGHRLTNLRPDLGQKKALS